MTLSIRITLPLLVLAIGSAARAQFPRIPRPTGNDTERLMAADGAVRGAFAGGFAVALADPHEDGIYAAGMIVGAINGAAIGAARGRHLSPSQAAASMRLSTLGALALTGATAAGGGLEPPRGRMAFGTLLAGGTAGYVLGPLYPDHARHRVTSGDVGVVELTALLGAAAAAAPVIDDGRPTREIAGRATVGLVAGTVLADQLLASRFDYAERDVRTMIAGAAAGARLGSYVGTASDRMTLNGLASATISGAVVGAVVGHLIAQPARELTGQRPAHDR